MPLYDWKCVNGHVDERYYHSSRHLPEDSPCRECGAPARQIFSVGKGLVHFEEGRGEWIQNLGPDPVYVTSHEQHKRLMKEAGVTWATKGKGMPGCWI